MKAYIINLPEASERKIHMKSLFENISICPVFIEAVIGKNLILPHKGFDEKRYRSAHGKSANLSELGCYFSHLRAIKQFLHDGDDYGLILEDDLKFDETIESIISKALKFNNQFDLLRLSGLHNGHPVNINSLNEKFSIACNLTRQTGAGAYLINRHAAKQLLEKLNPMWLPFDHAFDREWSFGVKAMCINPMPILQNITPESQINATKDYKLASTKRVTVFFYRFYNEICRVLFRTIQIIRLKITFF